MDDKIMELPEILKAFEKCGKYVTEQAKDNFYYRLNKYLSGHPEKIKTDISDAVIARVLDSAFNGEQQSCKLLTACFDQKPELADKWVAGAGKVYIDNLKQNGITNPDHLPALGILSKANPVCADLVAYHTIRKLLHDERSVNALRGCMQGDSGIAQSVHSHLDEAVGTYLDKIRNDPRQTFDAISNAFEIIALAVELTHGDAVSNAALALQAIEINIKPFCSILKGAHDGELERLLQRCRTRIDFVVDEPLRGLTNALILLEEQPTLKPA